MGNNKISDVGTNIAEKAIVIWNAEDMPLSVLLHLDRSKIM